MTDRELLELLVQKVAGIETKVTGIETKVTSIEAKVATIEEDIAAMKHDVSALKKDMNQVRQAVPETHGTVNRLEAAQSKTGAEVNNHSYAIDILNREQFYLKREIEKLKHR